MSHVNTPNILLMFDHDDLTCLIVYFACVSHLNLVTGKPHQGIRLQLVTASVVSPLSASVAARS